MASIIPLPDPATQIVAGNGHADAATLRQHLFALARCHSDAFHAMPSATKRAWLQGHPSVSGARQIALQELSDVWRRAEAAFFSAAPRTALNLKRFNQMREMAMRMWATHSAHQIAH